MDIAADFEVTSGFMKLFTFPVSLWRFQITMADWKPIFHVWEYDELKLDNFE